MHLLDSLTLQVEREERFRSRVKRYAGKWCSRGRSSSLLDAYDDCIKECDKAVERDRKHRPGKEQLLRKMEKSLDSCDQSVGEPGLSLKLWSEAC
ncbi:hypothetical protein DY000_02047765 [Brassica cretica]|uniref:Uncharacterized protein n=1 Tax=Brassica cretica TaxID=69181 RepID=A0ABQ7F2H9_BRACR|nr:hypothetical protein DY000_02047765 [Brassica cretica]